MEACSEQGSAVEPVAQCDLCGSERFAAWKTAPSHEWAAVWQYLASCGDKSSPYWQLPREFSYVRCLECGLVFTNPRVKQEIVASFYDDYLQGRFAQFLNVYDAEYRYQRQLELAISLDRMARGRFADQTLRSLDIGAALGSLMRGLVSLGWSAEGVEISPFAAEAARQYGRVMVGDAADLLTSGQAGHLYHVITLIDSLEHVGSPSRLLKACARAMLPGGIVSIEVPNVLSGLDEMSRHFHLFSEETLAALLLACGFEQVDTLVTGEEYNPTDGERPGRFVRATATRV